MLEREKGGIEEDKNGFEVPVPASTAVAVSPGTTAQVEIVKGGRCRREYLWAVDVLNGREMLVVVKGTEDR